MRAMSAVGSLWAVMKAYPMDKMFVPPIKMSEGHPKYMIPVFASREDAIEWSGSEDHVVALSAVPLKREDRGNAINPDQGKDD